MVDFLFPPAEGASGTYARDTPSRGPYQAASYARDTPSRARDTLVSSESGGGPPEGPPADFSGAGAREKQRQRGPLRDEGPPPLFSVDGSFRTTAAFLGRGSILGMLVRCDGMLVRSWSGRGRNRIV